MKKCNYQVLIFFSYLLGGFSRGFIVSSLPTPLIQIYSDLSNHFEPTKNVVAILSSANLIGSWISCILSTYLVFWFGKRNNILIADVVSLIGSVMHMFTVNWQYLTACRIISGYGTACLMTMLPMLFSEQVSVKHRGVFSSLMNYFITLGTVITNAVLILAVKNPHNFRIIYIMSASVNVGHIILTIFTKEVHHVGEQKQQVSIQKESIFQIKFWKCHLAGFALSLQGFCGINPMIVYSSKFFKFFDPKYNDILGCLIMTGINSVVVSSVIFTVRIFKRKILIGFGGGVLIVSLISIALCKVIIKEEKQQFLPLILLAVVYFFGFQISYGNLLFPILSEIFPLSIKVQMMNLYSQLIWIAIFAVTYMFPLLQQWLDYIIFGVVTFIQTVVLLAIIPETKDANFHEIEAKMIDHKRISKKLKDDTEELTVATQNA